MTPYAPAAAPPAAREPDECDGCLRRTALIADVAGCIDVEWRRKGAPPRLLALPDDALIALDASGRAARRFAAFDPAAARAAAGAARTAVFCRCSPAYPARLRDLEDPPAVLHVRGNRDVLDEPSLAVVGARRASAYGLEVARALGRGLAAAGVVVTSGMALGIDSAAHVGALEAGRTVAVLAGGADVPYPAGKRQLHGRIGAVGAVVSEMPPGTPVRRWAFVARNRIIAALGVATVLVEAAERSGSLTTADFALGLGRPVGAVPGLVTAPNAAGTNALIQAGAALVQDAADALDLAALDGLVVPRGPAGAAAGVPDELRPVLAAVEAGRGTATAIAEGTGDVGRVLEQLTELELRGLVRRSFGGRYVRAAW